jgi:hypothetical protein
MPNLALALGRSTAVAEADAPMATIVAAPELTVPEPQTPEQELAGEEALEYTKVAEEIGLEAPGVSIELVMAMLQDKVALGVYDETEVRDFLIQEARKESRLAKAVFVWRPLRRADRGWGIDRLVTPTDHGAILDSCTIHGEMTDQYTQKVPLPALMLVRDIENEIGKGVVKFFVSDYEAYNPDPFLMMATSRKDRRVIFHWDEPSWK